MTGLDRIKKSIAEIKPSKLTSFDLQSLNRHNCILHLIHKFCSKQIECKN